MSMNRFAHSVTSAVTGALLLCALPGFARGDNASRAPQKPLSASQGSQKAALPADDFAGLDLSDEQKGQIEKIKQETVRKQGIVANDTKLGPEQKDAMIQGYARLESGEIFRILTPSQQKIVRQRVAARRAAEQASKRPQAPRPPAPKN